MCEPATIASIALTAVSSIATVSAQASQARATARAQNEYNRQVERNQLEARNANLSALEQERAIAEADAREQINQNTRALRQAQATARVSAGEAGVSGLSVDALLRDLSGQAIYDNATAEENYLRQSAGINARRENAHRESVSAVNSVRNPVIQAPDYIGAALRIGQSGLSAYSDYRDRQDRRNNPSRI